MAPLAAVAPEAEGGGANAATAAVVNYDDNPFTVAAVAVRSDGAHNNVPSVSSTGGAWDDHASSQASTDTYTPVDLHGGSRGPSYVQPGLLKEDDSQQQHPSAKTSSTFSPAALVSGVSSGLGGAVQA